MNSEPQNKLRPDLQVTALRLIEEVSLIPEQRKTLLESFADHIREELRSRSTARLIFICTHNSRRSHMAQLWAQAAAFACSIEGIECYSGGTEATAFNPRAVRAMQEAGFEITLAANAQGPTSDNPLYDVRFADTAPVVRAFSKRFDHEFNPSTAFAAVMTCSDADEACPVVPGADARFAVRYDDPKSSDNSDAEQRIYRERCLEAGREMMYLMSCVQD